LDEERYRRIGEYSTGMRQRVKLAQALVHDPVLILLDEPTAGLDPAGREEMLDLVRRTAVSFGISIMLSTHLMGDIERTADRVVVLENGRVAREGPVSGFTKETETLLLEVDDKQGLVAAALRERGVTPVAQGALLVIENATAKELDAVRDALAETGARLRRLAPRRGTLTDIFRDVPHG
jgi:ABC-2 type transport system ATP-binding protein